MLKREYLSYVGDFETTVYDGQKFTEVWASAIVPLFSEDVQIYSSIDDTWDELKRKLKYDNVIVYYHNLKFDGEFWLNFLLKNGFTQAVETIGEEPYFLKEREMPNSSIKYSISDRGQWYTITVKYHNHFLEIRDSLKLLPFSVKRIGESFGTKHKKLDMEYKGFRYAGYAITDEEKQYIANDVLVVKEALEIMLEQGHDKLTIGACCLEEFKSLYDKQDYSIFFPNLHQITLNQEIFGSKTAGEYIQKSYGGGWCYVVRGKESKLLKNGITADVNSLYPSMMHSISGNRYPVGRPNFWHGEIPQMAIADNKYYFVRFRCHFRIKPGKLPFVHIRHSFLYKSNENLESSFVKMSDGKYYKSYYDSKGNEIELKPTLTMTCTEYKLFMEHYDVYDLEYLDGCWFFSEIGLFDEYINKYKQIKMTSKGAKRESAKLFLNNLYGKMAASTNSSFKVARLKEDGSLGFLPVHREDKKPGYIPIGSAITAYARNFTIRTAQQNYHGPHKPGFAYADTDSIHCDETGPNDLEGVPVDPTEFCHWKLESGWSVAIFARQKTYIEHVTKEDGEPCEPYYNIKCAGMPEKCKRLFETSFTGKREEGRAYTEEEEEFLSMRRSLEDFKVGLKVPGKLAPKHVKGGIILTETTYEMRG